MSARKTERGIPRHLNLQIQLRTDRTRLRLSEFPSGVRQVLQLFAGLEVVDLLAGTSTGVPVFGLRPTRDWRWRVRKLPRPRISTLSPRRKASTMLSKIASTMTSESFPVHLDDSRDLFDQIGFGHRFTFLDSARHFRIKASDVDPRLPTLEGYQPL
jgi:hypothetical protein